MGNNGKKTSGYLALAMAILSAIVSAKDVGKTLKDLRK